MHNQLRIATRRFEWRRFVISFTLIFTSFLVVSIAGFNLYNNSSINITPVVIWAPFGIAFAAVILEGYIALIPVALATLYIALLNGIPWTAVPLSIVIQVLQPSIALFALRRMHFDPTLTTIRDVALFLIVGALATTVAPTLRALWIVLNNHLNGTPTPILWATWWVGGALSVLVLASLLITLISRGRANGFALASSSLRSIEFAVAYSLFMGTCILMFATPYTSCAMQYHLPTPGVLFGYASILHSEIACVLAYSTRVLAFRQTNCPTSLNHSIKQKMTGIHSLKTRRKIRSKNRLGLDSLSSKR